MIRNVPPCENRALRPQQNVYTQKWYNQNKVLIDEITFDNHFDFFQTSTDERRSASPPDDHSRPSTSSADQASCDSDNGSFLGTKINLFVGAYRNKVISKCLITIFMYNPRYTLLILDAQSIRPETQSWFGQGNGMDIIHTRTSTWTCITKSNLMI